MSFFFNNHSAQPACTSNVHRPMGGIAGLREVHDDVGRLTVSVFPFAMVKDISLTLAAVPACYILADHATAYIGETGNAGRRLGEHSGDPSKAFAREVYVISGYQRAWFDKTAAIYLQFRLTQIAEQADLVDILKGTNPQVLELPNHKRASLDHFVEHGERLLFDAGCRVLRSNFASQRRKAEAVDTDMAIGPEDTGPMQIDVTGLPPLGSELELAYGDLWARGYPVRDGFVVTAGSEVRSLVNPSVNPILRTRRAELAAADALAIIPGIDDRARLRVAVCFPSAAIAAKVVTGAHVSSGKWVNRRYPEPILIAG
ncbi:putative GIY-YIG superfamily endonuclease [Bradyrhizobium japonicum]|uniref:GIY-YIG domain-containing protein n=2 Tax=Bradyrhizobium TaxID=374 RepID=A0A939RWK1_9BRAD|nr:MULTISPECIES: hypothetical protein [Bradyrhizobium]MBR0882881.1 hypothetical protein [Bradyrhizobium liaoningense]MBR1001300.1 hypothetical protein [Bradyrhizobium liaoningense]MBR1031183.1 hypothetical protein [Bradyrhizobium liaoningense]MBR1066192.1 hypothetical protein [Bradyrhizobium liaoningense]MCP1863850.1 putative GIY-YIG superfamily endonuclease [Bradyrhizobium japonicum]